jgi:hypothetical protein
VKYINAWIDLPAIESAIATRFHQCANRTLFYSQNNLLIKMVNNTPLLRYALGTETLNLQQHYLSSLESISQTKLRDLEEAYGQFRNHLKTVESGLVERLPLKL